MYIIRGVSSGLLYRYSQHLGMKVLLIAAAALTAAASLEYFSIPDAWKFSISLIIMVITVFIVCEVAERE